MTNTCPCGARKPHAMAVCNACWDSSPDRLRRTWRCGIKRIREETSLSLLERGQFFEQCGRERKSVLKAFEIAIKRAKAAPVAAPAPTLGTVQTSDRGFGRVEWQDTYGVPCKLTVSSSATQDAVWLGFPGADSMHLNRQMVTALVNHLNAWLTNGTFETGGAE